MAVELILLLLVVVELVVVFVVARFSCKLSKPRESKSTSFEKSSFNNVLANKFCKNVSSSNK
jgi:hypothetical protein